MKRRRRRRIVQIRWEERERGWKNYNNFIIIFTQSDGNDFAKRFNIKGLDDDYTTSTSQESHLKEKEREEEEGEKEEEEKEEEKVPLVKGNTSDDDEDNTDETNVSK